MEGIAICIGQQVGRDLVRNNVDDRYRPGPIHRLAEWLRDRARPPMDGRDGVTDLYR